MKIVVICSRIRKNTYIERKTTRGNVASCRRFEESGFYFYTLMIHEYENKLSNVLEAFAKFIYLVLLKILTMHPVGRPWGFVNCFPSAVLLYKY